MPSEAKNGPDEDYVVAAYAPTPGKAEKHRQVLEDHGIEAVVDEEYVPAHGRRKGQGIALLVPPDMLEDARVFIAEAEQADKLLEEDDDLLDEDEEEEGDDEEEEDEDEEDEEEEEEDDLELDGEGEDEEDEEEDEDEVLDEEEDEKDENLDEDKDEEKKGGEEKEEKR